MYSRGDIKKGSGDTRFRRTVYTGNTGQCKLLVQNLAYSRNSINGKCMSTMAWVSRNMFLLLENH